MVIDACLGWGVPTRDLIPLLGATKDGTSVQRVAKALRTYGLRSTYSGQRLLFPEARRLLRAGFILVASVNYFGIPHVVVVHGVRGDTLRIADPAREPCEYRRFCSEYVVTKVPTRRASLKK
jgi:ABC-type bacteriocin/lantibiotic exporter with double-glycine peptidase domain